MPAFTGHPLVDVGLATITAFAGKARPEDLSQKGHGINGTSVSCYDLLN